MSPTCELSVRTALVCNRKLSKVMKRLDKFEFGVLIFSFQRKC